MIPSNNRPESSLEETASLWAARLEGANLTPAQRRELDAWLDADPGHRDALSAYCQLSTDLERHLPTLLSSGSVHLPVTSPVGDRRSRRWSPAWGWLTAAAVSAVVIGFISVRPAPAPIETIVRYATPVAQRQSVTLEDGSRVDLNAGTHLVVEPSATERRVRLADGQAFFQVSKDPHRPFVVETPAGSVRVTGTAFDVRTTSAKEIEVTVLEGSVQVRLGHDAAPASTGPIVLSAADQLTAHGTASPTVHHIGARAVADALAWREGQIVFDETPLDEALARFAQFHGRGISADPGAAELSVTARYPLENLDNFFSSLEGILPVRVVYDQSGTVRVQLRD